jgi:hypothetical protein
MSVSGPASEWMSVICARAPGAPISARTRTAAATPAKRRIDLCDVGGVRVRRTTRASITMRF